jgi:uncharacterized metal-binding protein YceD (DUF177 family)
MSNTWSKPLRLGEIGRGGLDLSLAPDANERQAIARDLQLKSLPAFTAKVTLKPWMDGVEITGRFKAVVEQVCGVTLEPFEQPVDGLIDVRVVPPGSPQASVADGGEVEMDPEAPDPPDVLEGDTIDLAAYLIEHLALAIDPFPRKPGAVFDYTPATQEESPFAVLKRLKDKEA